MYTFYILSEKYEKMKKYLEKQGLSESMTSRPSWGQTKVSLRVTDQQFKEIVNYWGDNYLMRVIS